VSFFDAGADGRVVVGVSNTVAGLQALRHAADRAGEVAQADAGPGQP
jgi:hypothetical protein